MKAAALRLGLPVTDRIDDVIGAGAELGVVVAYGRLIRPHVLDALPMVNLHFSLLPRWRGAAPVERALLAGDRETGVCLMGLEEGLDTGPVYAAVVVPIGADQTAEELRAALVAAGTDLLVTHLAGGVAGLPTPVPQSGEPSYAAKIDAAELAIDWSRPADDVHRLVRLGRAWTIFRGKRLRIPRAALVPGPAPDGAGALDGLRIGCGDGRAIELVEVQPEGKAPQPAVAWRRGARPQPGERLGS